MAATNPMRDRKNDYGRQAIAKSDQWPRGGSGGQSSSMAVDSLHRYIGEVRRYKLLTRDEERVLVARYRTDGDQNAAYLLVVSNLRLVVKIAMDFQRVCVNNLLDLIQEGNIGLMQAVKKFDPSHKSKFSYYAAFWIKAYMLKFVMDNWRLVKLGTTQPQRKLFYRLNKEKNKLQEEGSDPTPDVLSKRLGVTEQEVVEMDQRLAHADVSLDAPLKKDSETERIEFLPGQETSIEEEMARKELGGLLHEKLLDFRKTIDTRELEIFDHRIYAEKPLTLRELGQRFGISHERVRQLERIILNKMKAFFQATVPDYVDLVTNGR